MGIGSYIQLALYLMRFVNWITGQISQAQWEASGRRKEMLAELAGLNESVGFAEQALKDAQAMSADEKRRRLEEAI